RPAGGRARCTPGARQVHGRSASGTRQDAAGAREVHGRSMRPGWMVLRSRPTLAHLERFMSHRPAPLDALDAADAAFRLLAAGPRPLGLHASRLAPGLPDRLVPVTELRVLLLHPATGPAARNAVWAELVRRARAGDPAWTVALAGIAMPGLRRAVASLAPAYRGDPADLQ